MLLPLVPAAMLPLMGCAPRGIPVESTTRTRRVLGVTWPQERLPVIIRWSERVRDWPIEDAVAAWNATYAPGGPLLIALGETRDAELEFSWLRTDTAIIDLGDVDHNGHASVRYDPGTHQIVGVTAWLDPEKDPRWRYDHTLHEVGHILGLNDRYDDAGLDSIMYWEAYRANGLGRQSWGRIDEGSRQLIRALYRDPMERVR